MKKIFAVVMAALLLTTSAAFARPHNKGGNVTHSKSAAVREEAVRRGMTLIGEDKARQIASRQIGSENIRVKELKLRNEADDYPDGTNFRPVYKLEVLSGYDEYELEIDAVTGKILKYELDD